MKYRSNDVSILTLRPVYCSTIRVSKCLGVSSRPGAPPIIAETPTEQLFAIFLFKSMSVDTVFIVRPAYFTFNAETAISNKFQHGDDVPSSVAETASKEFDNFENILKKYVNVITINDTPMPIKPDAVFPNNWITFHIKEHNKIILYPMCAENRRLERRLDVIDSIKKYYNLNICKDHTFNECSIIDLSNYENQKKYLEGTGSMIFDHTNKIIYACLSERSHIDVLEELSSSANGYLNNYQIISFLAMDKNSFPVYHSNVMLSIADKYVVVCTEAICAEIPNELPCNMKANSIPILTRAAIIAHLQKDRELIEITMEQMNKFAGNMLELRAKPDFEPKNDEHDPEKSLLFLSETAFNSLDVDQINSLSKYSELVSIPVPTIEKYGGGSIRCMMCEIR